MCIYALTKGATSERYTVHWSKSVYWSMVLARVNQTSRQEPNVIHLSEPASENKSFAWDVCVTTCWGPRGTDDSLRGAGLTVQIISHCYCTSPHHLALPQEVPACAFKRPSNQVRRQVGTYGRLGWPDYWCGIAVAPLGYPQPGCLCSTHTHTESDLNIYFIDFIGFGKHYTYMFNSVPFKDSLGFIHTSW